MGDYDPFAAGSHRLDVQTTEAEDLAHLDVTWRRMEPAERFLSGDVQAEIAARGVDAMPPSPSTSSPR